MGILRASGYGSMPDRLPSPPTTFSTVGSGAAARPLSGVEGVDRPTWKTFHWEGSFVTYTDKVLQCADCGVDFVFSASEQQFFAQKGFASAPKRCASCRAQRRATMGGGSSYGNGGGGSYGRGPREPYFKVNHVLGLARACQQGLGVAALPDYLVEERHGLVQLFSDTGDSIQLDTYFVYPEELKTVARVQVFRDFIVSKAQRWSPKEL